MQRSSTRLSKGRCVCGHTDGRRRLFRLAGIDRFSRQATGDLEDFHDGRMLEGVRFVNPFSDRFRFDDGVWESLTFGLRISFISLTTLLSQWIAFP